MSTNFRRFSFQTLSGLALLVLIPFLAAPAEAQTTVPLQAGDFEAGFGVGATRFDDTVSDDDADYRVEGRGGYFFTDGFELEVQAARAVGVLDLQLDTAFVNAVFNFPVGRAVPYVLVGAGGARIDDGGLFEESRTENGTAYQAALGSRFFFGDSRMAARVELSSAWENALDDTSNHLSLTGGLVWRIGR
jgi:hypothetical protein